MAKLYGRGTIREIVPGEKYEIVFSYGKDPDTKKYRRHKERFDGTKRKAELRVEELRRMYSLMDELHDIGLSEDELATYGLTKEVVSTLGMSAREVAAELEKRKADRANDITFAEWCECYLSTREARNEKRKNTYKSDRSYSKHLINGLGDKRLTDIKPSAISSMYADMRKRGVGATTINQSHKLLKRIMHAALLDELINRNPVELVETPKKPKPKRRALTAEQAMRIRDLTSYSTPTANKVAVFLGLSLGARIGEVLGLEWQHVTVNGEHPNIYIVQQYLGNGKTGPLKTDDDNNPVGRVVPIDSSTVELLKQWKAQQRNILNELGIEQGERTPVISNEIGGYSDRHNFSAWFRSWCVENGFGQWLSDDGRRIVELTVDLDDPSLYEGCIIEWRDIEGWPCDENGKRFSRTYKRPLKIKRHYDGLVYHELRHSHFTLRLASGTSIPVAQALGGWSTPAMLTEVYLHATPEGIWDEAGFMSEVISKQGSMKTAQTP